MKTAMKIALRSCPQIRQKHRKNIPVKVYTCGAVCGITQVTRDVIARQVETGRLRLLVDSSI
jgi:hypothetical protein